MFAKWMNGMCLPWARRGENRYLRETPEKKKKKGISLSMIDSWALYKEPSLIQAITIYWTFHKAVRLYEAAEPPNSSLHIRLEVCIKLDKTSSFQISGLQMYFLIHSSKPQRSYPLSSKTNPGDTSSAASERYPWSTFLQTTTQALLWGKVWCDVHTSCQANSIADAWVDWNISERTFPFWKVTEPSTIKLSTIACSSSNWHASKVHELRRFFAHHTWLRGFLNFNILLGTHMSVT